MYFGSDLSLQFRVKLACSRQRISGMIFIVQRKTSMWSAEILRWQSISFFAGELSHGSILITLAVVALILDATRLVTPAVFHVRLFGL